VFNVDEAKRMTDAGADVVVAHMGLTTKGSIGATTAKSLDDCVREIAAIVDACKKRRGDVLVICHGGPIAMPEDAEYVLARCVGVDGFYGASSMERLPTEIAITKQVKDFVGLRVAKR
jgi:predicted TIM-barrel enzyme